MKETAGKEQHIETNAFRPASHFEEPSHSSVIAEHSDNLIQKRAQARDAAKAFRLTEDKSNSFTIDLGKGLLVTDKRPHATPVIRENPNNWNQTNYQSDNKSYDHNNSAPSEKLAHKLNNLAYKHFQELLEQNGKHDKTVFSDSVSLTDEAGQIAVFQQHIDMFRQRAQMEGLLPKDLEKTFFQIDRLIESESNQFLSRADRFRLAEQILSHAADPTKIDQGGTRTCAPAAIEARIFSRNPAEAARLIVDIALTGEYQTTKKYSHNGSMPAPIKVELNPQAHGESHKFPTVDGDRTFASEIFQVATVNLCLEQINNFAPFTKYIQREPLVNVRNDTGELMVDKRTGKAIQPEINSPNLPDMALGPAIDAITGTNHGNDAVIVNRNYLEGPACNATIIDSLKDLQNSLARLKVEHKLPVIMKVNCLCEPFYLEAGIGVGQGAEESAHAVIVKDYDAQKGQVLIDNAWGELQDHGKNKPVDITDLYIASQDTAHAVRSLQKLIDEDKTKGRFDPRKHMQQCRLQSYCGELGQDAYKKSVDTAVKTTANRWNKISTQEKNNDELELIAMTHGLLADQRSSELAKAYRAGVLQKPNFETELCNIGIDIATNNQTEFTSAVQANKNRRELTQAMRALTIAEQTSVENRISVFLESLAKYRK